MLDFAPLARAGREMANMIWHLQLDRQFLKSDFPQATTAAIATTTVGRDQQLPCIAISPGVHLFPPACDGLGGKARGVVVDAHTHPALVLTDVVDTIGNGSPTSVSRKS